MRHAPHTVLSGIDAFTKDDDLRVVKKAARGSRNKYGYDPECDCVQLSTVLAEARFFPSILASFLRARARMAIHDPVEPGCVVRTPAAFRFGRRYLWPGVSLIEKAVQEGSHRSLRRFSGLRRQQKPVRYNRLRKPI